jgi:hypothetical protein
MFHSHGNYPCSITCSADFLILHIGTKIQIQIAAISDQVYQLLAHGWWFSPGTPASSTTKAGRHDIAEILPKVALSTKNKINLLTDKLYHIMFYKVYIATSIYSKS